MRNSITAKLFLAILAGFFVVIFVQTVALRSSFQNGLLRMLDEEAIESLERTLPAVQESYATHGSWDFLSERSAWADVMISRYHAFPARKVTSADQLGAPARMGLLDADFHFLAGNPLVSRKSVHRPVLANGKTVGFLAVVPMRQAMEPSLEEFFQSQRQTWLVLLGISVLVVAGLAFLLTRVLRERLRMLEEGTQAMSEGKFDVRIEPGVPDELGRLARAFNGMAQTLEHAERARRNFMADISHELRTPLAVVRAEVESLQDGVRRGGVDSLANIAEHAKLLGSLIDDLHDLSLTDVGAMAYRFQVDDLAIELEAVLSTMAPRFSAASLELVADVDQDEVLVAYDSMRMRQLFENLLENALRYTDPGGVVKVSCKKAGEWVKVAIEDTAPGVREEQLPKLFDRFYRAEPSRNRATGGSGLGLAISRNIVEAHQGVIHANAASAGGLAVTLSFPLASPSR